MIKEKLRAIVSIILTTNVWTETMNTIGYLGLTAHFSNVDKISSITIGLIELDERHTATFLEELLAMNGIYNYVRCIFSCGYQ